jgi:hypothetical protein
LFKQGDDGKDQCRPAKASQKSCGSTPDCICFSVTEKESQAVGYDKSDEKSQPIGFPGFDFESRSSVKPVSRNQSL